MATVDLRLLEGDQIVIHFGGALTSVDAYTFANSLIAFADTVRAVNRVLDPNQGIEVRLEAIGPGSFRAAVKRIRKGLGGFFSRGAEAVFWGVIATLIYEKALRPDDGAPKITITSDEVIIQHGEDTVIVPRAVYDQARNVRNDPDVQLNLSRTFQAVERDEAIENFGLTPSVDDPEPLVQIPRSDFSALSDARGLIGTDRERRIRTERARLVITKAWLRSGNRKWAFEWNGVPISAPIRDHAFLERLERREFLIGYGDALDVMIQYEQVYDPGIQMFTNDVASFLIVEVIGIVSRS
jgi:hypothetical protein